MFYGGTQHPWEFKRVWHLEPDLTDADTVYAGIEDAGLFKSVDAGMTWQELPALRDATGHLKGKASQSERIKSPGVGRADIDHLQGTLSEGVRHSCTPSWRF